MAWIFDSASASFSCWCWNESDGGSIFVVKWEKRKGDGILDVTVLGLDHQVLL